MGNPYAVGDCYIDMCSPTAYMIFLSLTIYIDHVPSQQHHQKPGDNTKNSIKSIDSLAHAKLQSSRRLMIHAHMLIEIKHYSKLHLDVDKLRAYMESAMGHHIHVNYKIPGSGKEDLNWIKAYIQKEETS